MVASRGFLGYGVTYPLRRSGGDFDAAGGEDLVFSHVPYILLTRSDTPYSQGEQPWDTEMGSGLRAIQFSTLSGEALRNMVEYHVVRALERNEPRIRVTGVDVDKYPAERLVEIRLSLALIERDNESNEVRFTQEQDITLRLPF